MNTTKLKTFLDETILKSGIKINPSNFYITILIEPTPAIFANVEIFTQCYHDVYFDDILNELSKLQYDITNSFDNEDDVIVRVTDPSVHIGKGVLFTGISSTKFSLYLIIPKDIDIGKYQYRNGKIYQWITTCRVEEVGEWAEA
jgi:hypothetical protein